MLARVNRECRAVVKSHYQLATYGNITTPMYIDFQNDSLSFESAYAAALVSNPTYTHSAEFWRGVMRHSSEGFPEARTEQELSFMRVKGVKGDLDHLWPVLVGCCKGEMLLPAAVAKEIPTTGVEIMRTPVVDLEGLGEWVDVIDWVRELSI